MNKTLAERYFQEADRQFREGRFEDALATIAVLDEAFPNKKNVMFAKARCLGAMGNAVAAIRLCDQILERYDAPRAQRLKEQLIAGEDVAPIVEVTKRERSALRRQRRLRVARYAVSAVVFAGLLASVGVAAAYRYGIETMGTATDAPSAEALEGAIAEHRRNLEEERLAEANAPTEQPGQLIPEHVWRATAVDGIPDWKPGAYRQVPCVNAPDRTIDVYVPMAYQEKPEATFPGLMISMPGGNPDFLNLEDWAESREVVLIAINSSRNGTFKNNHIAQQRMYETVLPNMRIHQKLAFAIGASGGARTNWNAICRDPDYFAGIVMIAFPASSDVCERIPSRVRVAFLHGDEDFNADGVYYSIPRVKANGNEVQHYVHQGDHGAWPPHETIVQVLDWMVSEGRADYGLAQPQY